MPSFKETILLVGPDNVGKTSILLELARFHPENKCVLFDFENHVDKIKYTYHEEVSNVEVIDIDEWAILEKEFDRAQRSLQLGDWLLVDGLDKAWDMIQAEYEDGKDKAPDMWQWTKKKHNKEFMDKATGRGKYSFAASVYAYPNDQFNISRETDPEVKKELGNWRQFGFRPGGEKRNTSRFETVFALKHEYQPERFFVSTFKDKGRPFLDGGDKSLWLPFEFPFWPTYLKVCQDAVDVGRKVPMPV